MKAIICFIIGYLIALFCNYINKKKEFTNIERPKTLNIGDSDDVIKITPGITILVINSPSNINNFDLEKLDDVIFYVSSSNKYILYKDKNFKYVKLDASSV